MCKEFNKLLLLLIIGVSPFFLFGCDNNGKAQGIQIPFEDSRIIFEVNSTDGDAGIQIFLDSEDAWNEVRVSSPNEEQIFEALGKGNLEGFGLSELFSESNEPPFEEMSLQEVLDLFPAGTYQFRGTTAAEGDELVGEATLTHDIPCGPDIVSPLAGQVLDPSMPVFIEWETVTNKLDPDAQCGDSEIEIFGYQVIVDTFQVTLPADATRVTVPPEFIEPNTMYSFEVLAIEDPGTEEGGNQTITEGFFCTDPLTPCPTPAP